MHPLPLLYLGLQTIRPARACKARLSKAFDQARVDQQPIKPSRLRAAGASVKQTVAAFQNILLLGKRRIERHTRSLLHQQRQIGRVERLQCRRHIDWLKIYSVDRVVTRVVARIEGLQMPRDRGLGECRIDNTIRKFRLMVAKANDQERVGREVAFEPVKQRGVVLRAQSLPPDIFIDAGAVSETAPVRREFRTKTHIPREMIGGGVNEKKQRAAAAFAGNNVGRLVEVEAVALKAAGAEILHVEIAFNTGRRLKAAGAKKRAIKWIKAEGLVTAAGERIRQSARDMPGRDARHGCGKTSVRTRRQSGQHVIFGKPAGTARAFHDQLTR